MFRTIKQAGLSVDEFSFIVDVNRTSIFNWKAGRSKPHPQVAGRVDKAIAFIAALIEREKLPLKPDLDRDERRVRVQKIKALFQQYH